MLERLHRRMTFFCALITGIILAAMSLLCLFYAENATRQNEYQAFQSDLNAVVSYLENQTVISNQWLSQTEGGQKLILDVYDNGEPLMHNSLAGEAEREGLVERAKTVAAEEYGLDIFQPVSNTVLSQQADFTMRDGGGREYYAAAALFPKKDGFLSAVLVWPLEPRNRRIVNQRLLFAAVDAAGLAALVLFSWFFTGRMLRPVEESRRKQAQFVAAASHELRSPLAVMLSNLSALQKAGPEERERFEENIRAGGSRMSRLVDDMLVLATADGGAWSMVKSPQDMDTLVLELYERYQGPARDRGISLSVSLPEEPLPVCDCDGGRVEQALSVLLDNALAYTPRGGKVELSAETQGGRVKISVRDNGPGVPDSHKAHIFDRFYRADDSRRDREHFGLGLCVAKEIAVLHKGKLWVEDTPGGGATFSMLL